MVLLFLKVDNLYEFHDFEINLTYPKKIVNSSIDNEHLDGFPNFRYKKVVFVMGANATGKTILGKALMDIMNFISKKEYSSIAKAIGNPSAKASFLIDLAFDDVLYRIEAFIKAQTEKKYSSDDFSVCVRSEKIKKGDSYESCLNRLLGNAVVDNSDYVKSLEMVPELTWMYKYSVNDSQYPGNSYEPIDQNRYLTILESVLKVLDPRIQGVRPVESSKDTYNIVFENRNALIQNSLPISGNLSSGTAESIAVAQLLAGIKAGGYKFFYCDERFAHVHSDSEKAFISLLVDCLQANNQLFITSHNIELLNMDFPKHSFVFLRRRELDNKIECIYPADYLKRNSDSLKNAVENDLFGASPNIDQIYCLKEL